MSRRPKRSTTASAAAATATRSRTSQAKPRARSSPRSPPLLDTRPTEAPASWRLRATAAPIPPLAPVTNATCLPIPWCLLRSLTVTASVCSQMSTQRRGSSESVRAGFHSTQEGFGTLRAIDDRCRRGLLSGNRSLRFRFELLGGRATLRGGRGFDECGDELDRLGSRDAVVGCERAPGVESTAWRTAPTTEHIVALPSTPDVL
jgi:hypothetical protein